MTLIGTTKFLVRFSEIEWLHEMKKGALRFTPLSRYRARELQDDAERFDAFEGASRIDQPNSVKRVALSFRDKDTGALLMGPDGASLGGIEHKLAGPILWFDPSGFSHVLCLSIHEQELRSGDNSMDLKKRSDGFGSSTLLVHDIAEFVKRVGEFMTNNEIPFECGPVEYVAADYGGDYGAFKKPSRLEHQHEYRLAVRVDSAEVVELTVPNLGQTMEVFKGLQINIRAAEIAT